MTVETVGPFEVHTMPSGDRVFYRDSDHSYWRDAKKKNATEWSGTGRLTGVSTVVSPYDWRPDSLMNWAARMTADGVAVLAAEGLSLDDLEDMRASLGWLITGDAISDALLDARLRHSDHRDDAASRGTNVHKHSLAALAEGRPTPDYPNMTDEERGYSQGVVGFWLDNAPKVIASEAVVCDLELGIAGRLDLLAMVGTELWLPDCKTSGFISLKHHVQVAGYVHCAGKSGYGVVDRADILQVTPDGRYELLPVRADETDLLAAVELYRRAAKIGNAAKADRKALEAVAA